MARLKGSSWTRLGRLAGLGVLSLGLVACANPLGLGPEQCDRSVEGNPPVVYRGGESADGVYQSSAWGGEWLSFPGGMHYALEHGLGSAPLWVQPYLSFNEQGLGQGLSVDDPLGDGGSSPGSDTDTSAPAGLVSPAAGDVVSILGVDERFIVLANKTCASYYLRVVAGSAPAP